MKTSPSFSAYTKSPYRSIKHTTYFSVYDHLFSKFRNKKIVFIEIGVLAGCSLFMLIKNIPSKYLVFVIISRILFDLGISIVLFFKLKPSLSYSILKAYSYLLLNLFSVIKKRSKSDKIDNYYYIFSLLISYYIRKQKKFSSF